MISNNDFFRLGKIDAIAEMIQLAHHSESVRSEAKVLKHLVDELENALIEENQSEIDWLRFELENQFEMLQNMLKNAT